MADESVIRPPDNVTVLTVRPVVYDAYGRAWERQVGFSRGPMNVQTGGQFPQLQIPKPPRKGGKHGKKGC